jgi:hypothetical protein
MWLNNNGLKLSNFGSGAFALFSGLVSESTAIRWDYLFSIFGLNKDISLYYRKLDTKIVDNCQTLLY